MGNNNKTKDIINISTTDTIHIIIYNENGNEDHTLSIKRTSSNYNATKIVDNNKYILYLLNKHIASVKNNHIFKTEVVPINIIT